jgi:membrane protein involved in colicin uptake
MGLDHIRELQAKRAAELAKAQQDAAQALTAKTQAEVARDAALTAKTQAESEKAAALTAKTQAETEKAAALTAQTKAESEKAAALTAQTKAETEKAAALTAQTKAEGELSTATTVHKDYVTKAKHAYETYSNSVKSANTLCKANAQTEAQRVCGIIKAYAVDADGTQSAIDTDYTNCVKSIVDVCGEVPADADFFA